MGIVRLMLFIAGVFFVMNGVVVAGVFTDVSVQDEFEVQILDLAQKGVIEGYEDGTFRPNDLINRAEFTKIIVEAAFPGQKYGADCFNDVSDEWFAPYICFAKEHEIIQGYEDGSFRPDQPINFVEASKIVAIAFDLKIDEKYIEYWFEKYVVALERAGAIPRSILHFDQRINRGEMSFVTSRSLMEYPIYQDFTYAHIKAISQLGKDVERMPMDNLYSLDGRVYMIKLGHARLLEGADAASFEHVTGLVYKDKKTVYIIDFDPYNISVNKSDGVFDTESFEVLHYSNFLGYFVRDKNGFYYGFLYFTNPRLIESFDAANFELISGSLFTDGQDLYTIRVLNFYRYTDQDVLIDKVDFVDLGTFQFIESLDGYEGEEFFSDLNGVYMVDRYGIRFIDRADRESFQIMKVFADYEFLSPEYARYYLKDKNAVWILNPDHVLEKLEGVDPEGFDYKSYLIEKGVEYEKVLG